MMKRFVRIRANKRFNGVRDVYRAFAEVVPPGEENSHARGRTRGGHERGAERMRGEEGKKTMRENRRRRGARGGRKEEGARLEERTRERAQ